MFGRCIPLIVLLSLAVAFLGCPSDSKDKVSVPNVVGKTQAEASSAITAAGLVVGTVTQEYSGTVPAGKVIRQEPAGGTQVSPGSSVRLVVSRGPQPASVPVPDVRGMAQAQASSVITGAGLNVGTVTQAYSATVAAGAVISQSPAQGASVAPGTSVNLTVSKGPERVAVPNVVGKTQAQAASALIAAGLAVGTVTEQYSATVAAGSVISQSPLPGSIVNKGSAVGLVVSKGKQPVATPDVVGKSQTQAAAAITGVGLKVGVVTIQYSETIPAGQVVDQDPDAGTLLVPGSAVKLVVAKNGIAISSVEELQLIGNDPDYPLDGCYYLSRNINASATAAWDSGAGFVPIGEYDEADPSSKAFVGTLDGQDYTITGLAINRPGEDRVGLFAVVGDTGEVTRVRMSNASVSGRLYVGGLVGWNIGTVSDCHVSCIAAGRDDAGATSEGGVGGLVGYNSHGTVSDCSSAGTVTGVDYVGGLVGDNRSGAVSGSHSTATVKGICNIGGLVGLNYSGAVAECHASGAVAGDCYVGGLVGWACGGTVTECHASGAVSGGDGAGGLVGFSWGGKVTDCHATGQVDGDGSVGGLVGQDMGGRILRAYSTGSVTGVRYLGGLLGWGDGDVEKVKSSFWDTQTSAMTTSWGGTGLTTAQMQTPSTFTGVGWDFANVWYTLPGGSYPFLKDLPVP